MNISDKKFILKDFILKPIFGKNIVWIFLTISIIILLYYLLVKFF